jgi:ribosomal protein S27AE
MPRLTTTQRRLIAPPCTVEGCGRRQERSRDGLCELHVRRLKTHGTLDKPKHWKLGTGREGPCTVEGCDKPRHARGTYCAGHGHRARRYGDPLFDPIAAKRSPCVEEGCANVTTAPHGVCVRCMKRRYNVQERGTQKRLARIALGNAVQQGKIKRQPCEKCGVERAQAHHDDYSKPLEVRWLCPKHHAEEHA